MYKTLKRHLGKIFVLQYLHKCFLMCREYVLLHSTFINYSKTKRYLNKKENKDAIRTIKDYLLKSKKENFRKIVFIINGDLQEIGGVETRLLKTLKYLETQNFFPVIIAKDNSFEPILSKYPFIKFSFKNRLTSKFFINIIKKIKPEYIELQIKNISSEILVHFDKKQVNDLKKITKVGILFHFKQYFVLERQLESFDNILSCGTDWLKKYKKLQHKIYKIPNYIIPQTNSWSYSGQTKLLFISRLNEQDKIQHIYNLISLYKDYTFNIDIAGSGEQSFIDKIKKFAQNNNVIINFIGKINTLEYLNKNLNNILFVAGVGQVIFEATSFNIPSLVLTDHKEESYSNFLTKDNVQRITAYNCVLNKLKLSENNIGDFVADIPNNLEKYKVKDFIEKNYSIDKIMNVYMDACKIKRI